MKKLLLALCLFLFSCNAAVAPVGATSPKLDKKPYIVMFQERTGVSEKDITEAGIKSLQDYYSKSFQTPSSPFLAPKLLPETVLWITRGFSIKLSPTDLATIQGSGLIQSVLPVRKVSLPKIVRTNPHLRDSYTYGLTNIKIPETRAAYPTLIGTGVKIGIIDSGVLSTHPDLSGKVANWRDFIGTSETPYDDNGHGTHVAGTIAGGNASGTYIGVAPGSSLAVAKSFDSYGNGTDVTILGATQWLAGLGNVAVINNSWTYVPFTTDTALDPYSHASNVLQRMGVYVVGAAGNSGPNASTMESPGGLPVVLGVGAVDSSNVIASFSSRGPLTWKRKTTDSYRKPDVVAPGVQIYSSWNDGNYALSDGTSMATPHVTGIVALVKQLRPTFKYKLLTKYIKAAAFLPTPGQQPDNSYGRGIVNTKYLIDNLPAWPFGEENALHVLNGQTVTIAAGSTHDYESITVDSGGVLQVVSPASNTDMTIIGVAGNFNLQGSLIVNDGQYYYMVSSRTVATPGDAGDLSGESITYQISTPTSNPTGGAGGDHNWNPQNGGAQAAGNGGGGASISDGLNAALAKGGDGAPGVCFSGDPGTAGIGASIYGNTGGAGVTGSGLNCWAPGGGGGSRGMHGRALYIKVKGNFNGSSGTIYANGRSGGTGGRGGDSSYTGAGGGGGGGGGFGGVVNIRYHGTYSAPTISVSGGSGGAGGAAGNDGGCVGGNPCGQQPGVSGVSGAAGSSNVSSY
jgi:hypothetical protein